MLICYRNQIFIEWCISLLHVNEIVGGPGLVWGLASLVAKNPDCLYFGTLPLERCCFHLRSIMAHKHTCFKQMDERRQKGKFDLFSLGNIPDITHITSHIFWPESYHRAILCGRWAIEKLHLCVAFCQTKSQELGCSRKDWEGILETAKHVTYQLVTLVIGKRRHSIYLSYYRILIMPRWRRGKEW